MAQQLAAMAQQVGQERDMALSRPRRDAASGAGWPRLSPGSWGPCGPSTPGVSFTVSGRRKRKARRRGRAAGRRR